MSFETPTQTASETVKEKALDEGWHAKLISMEPLEALDKLNEKKKILEKQKALFDSGRIRNPELTYSKLEKFNLDGLEKSLLELKEEVNIEEENEAIKLAYRWTLNERIARVRMLRATKNKDDKKFFRYARFIYGMPDDNVFKYSMEQISRNILTREKHEDLRIKFAISRLKDALPWLDEKSDIEKPPFEQKSLIIDPNNAQKKFNAEAINEMFKWFLENRGLREWTIVIDEDGARETVGVSQLKKEIKIPKNREVQLETLHGLIEHEIGVHAIRGNHGERSKLKLLSNGLDRFTVGEEGVATYAEQKAIGSEDYAGLAGHLAISLATGVDGEKRDFREVYNILRDYFFVNSNTVKLDKAWENAKSDAWNRCMRTFRGTTGGAEGICFTKDIAYREGNIAIWNIIKKNPEEEKRFSIGKYDPTNPRHIWILEQLGISDIDLESLDK